MRLTSCLINPPVTLSTATAVVPEPRRTVTYEFNTRATKPTLPILYAVVIDGKVREQEASSVGVIRDAPRSLTIGPLKKGTKVALHLHTDACVGWRKSEVCQVTVGDWDVVVKVTEERGKKAEAGHNVDPAKGKEVYKFPLDGALWMKVSHQYTPEEARTLLAQQEDESVKAAVQRIYDGLTQGVVTFTSTKTGRSLAVRLDDASNASSNIAMFDPLRDGARRVHPLAYVAVFRAALQANVKTIQISSGWRPLMGSIAHRAGIGLDIAMLGELVLHRGQLIGNAPAPDNVETVAEGEKALLGRYRAARARVKAAKESRTEATLARNQAEKHLKSVRKKVTAAQGRLAEHPSDQAHAVSDVDVETARRARVDVLVAAEVCRRADEAYHEAANEMAEIDRMWRAEMAKTDAYHIAASFRDALAACPVVTQIIDPWFIDGNTHDATPGAINTMEEETTGYDHRHHFHITIRVHGISFEPPSGSSSHDRSKRITPRG